MNKSILGAVVSLCLCGVPAQAAPAQPPAALNAGDTALLANVTQDQHAALIYTVLACGLAPTPATAAALLKSPRLAGITEAVARHDPPLLDAKACAALTTH